MLKRAKSSAACDLSCAEQSGNDARAMAQDSLACTMRAHIIFIRAAPRQVAVVHEADLGATEAIKPRPLVLLDGSLGSCAN